MVVGTACAALALHGAWRCIGCCCCITISSDILPILLPHPNPTVTLGGSLTFGRGASDMGRTDWAALLRAWLQTRFPGAGHELLNGAVAASPSEYMAFCVQDHLPPPEVPVDLVLVRR